MAALTTFLLFALVGSSVASSRSLLQTTTTNPTFTNGDFALPGSSALNPGGYTELSPQTPDVITGWVITAGNVDYTSNIVWQAPPGASYSVDLSGDQPGTLVQTFATVPGTNYSVSFYLAGSPYGTPIKTCQLSAAGASAQYAFDITNATTTQMGYLPQVFNFVAADANTTLQFTSLTNELNGPVIGDVVVSGAGAASPTAAVNGTAAAPGPAANATAPVLAPAPGPGPEAAAINGSLTGLAPVASAVGVPAPAPAPASTTPIVATFIVPVPLASLNSTAALANLTAALNSEFGTPSTTATITNLVPGPDPATQTAVTFSMEPTTVGATIPQTEQDNLRAAFTQLVQNKETLLLPAPLSPPTNFTVVSFPGGASIIGSGAPYGAVGANTTVGLFNFTLPRSVDSLTANETLLLGEVSNAFGLKPAEVLTVAFAAVNGSANATQVSTALTTIGAFADSPARVAELTANISAALKNGTLGLDPATFGLPSNIVLSPAIASLLTPGASFPPGTTIPPGVSLPPNTTLPPGVSTAPTTPTTNNVPGAVPPNAAGTATRVGYTLAGLASAVLVAALF